ncbi:type IX secretion system periplasmic lipoprotein PorW/SprE [Pseudoprevotella muciniphila]|nr:tetratricopeptide repeat protein [Pseudoprevotella muciniphila]
MRILRKKHISVVILLAVAMLLTVSCSTQKNTAMTRFYHSFTANYNTYFNGHQAFTEGVQSQEKSNKDDYTQIIPVFPVGNESTRSAGKSNFETAIKKAEKAIKAHSIQAKPDLSARERRSAKGKQKLAMVEYNPFLKNAWMMMGKSQFYKGEFIEAASTFGYIIRMYAAEPKVANEARTWLARCYSGIDWHYDAENTLRLVSKDSMTSRISKEYQLSMADLLVRQEQFDAAIPFLTYSAKHTGSSLQKARLWFLLAQLYRMKGDTKLAYKSLSKTISKNPPFELDFAARIMQTQVLSTNSSQGVRMISKLKRMSHNPKYKDHLEQVYFAMGNIYLAREDTTNAIASYEKGRTKSTSSSIEKGVLLLKLGELYWDIRRYDHAQKCYSEAIGMLDKKREGYDEATRRSKVLDKLVPYTNAVHLQDSLQALSVMDEKDRNAAIDRAIEMEKARQEAERKAKKDSAAQARANEMDGDNGTLPGNNNRNNSKGNANNTGETVTWYFYNPQAVLQGKENFRKIWGQRKNEDNWRRSNRTVLADIKEEIDLDNLTDEQKDSLAQEEARADSIAKAEKDSMSLDVNNPLKRDYYMKQIPFTQEQKDASNLIIMDGLHHAGVIMKDDMEDKDLAESMLGRVVNQYPTYSQMQDVYYQLFLMYLRWNEPDKAERYKLLLQEQYPESDTTKIVTNPNFERNMKFGRELEDRLYTETYEAFKLHDYATVEENTRISGEEFPDGINRPKFLFVSALSRLTPETDKEIAKELRELVKKFPDSDVSKLAGMIVKGIEAGRKVGQGGYDMSSLWSYRTSSDSVALDSASAANQLSAERDIPFVCIIAYPSDSLDDNTLLYNLARFNFGEYTSRNYDMSIESARGLTQFRITGFENHREAHGYAHKIYQDKDLAPTLRRTRIFLVSEKNQKLIGVNYSFDDYAKYYEKMFAPLKLDSTLTVDEDPAVKMYYEDEVPDDPQANRITDENDGDEYDISGDNGEQYEEIPIDVPATPSANEGEDIPVAQEKTDDTGGQTEEIPILPSTDTGNDDTPSEEIPAPAQPDAPAKPEPTKKEEPAKEEPTPTPPAQPEAPAKPEQPTKKEPAKEEPTPTIPAQPEQPAKQEPTKTEPAKPEPTKTEPAKEEPAKKETPKQPEKEDDDPVYDESEDDPIYEEDAPEQPAKKEPAKKDTPEEDDEEGEWYPI